MENKTTMTEQTIQALQTLGIDPEVVQQGKTFQQSGKHYQGATYLKTTGGHMLFRTTRDGQLKMLTGELLQNIFA